MTDALCGPSNALSSFQKHTQVDRTLQQDRLTGLGQSPAQGFRSFDPRTGSLDAEFHAFENTPTNPFQLEQPPWQQPVRPAVAAPNSSSWATDFQNLRISNSPIPVSQFRTEAPLVMSTNGGWQQEFLRSRQNLSPVAQQKQAEMAPQMGNQLYQSYLGGSSYIPQQPYMDRQSSAMQMDSQDLRHAEAEFDQAFQDAFEQIATERLQEQNPTQEQGHDAPLTELQTDIQEPSPLKIGSDAIDYTETQDRTVDQDSHDASELAKVAGQLVQNVSHETDDKFKNSQFLDLMRRIRDREIEVRNNDLEMAQGTSVPTPERLNPPATATDQKQDTFQFPNMDEVYYPDSNLDMTAEDRLSYHERPQTQISDLHPGGPLYPEQSPPQPRYARMSGAVDTSLPTDDDNGRYAAA